MKKIVYLLPGVFFTFCLSFAVSAQTITTFAGNGTLGYSGDGGDATAAKLNLPMGVCRDAAGNVYIADGSNHRIRKVNPAGAITTFAGTGTSGFSGDGGAATAANLSYPRELCIDTAGNIYIAETSNHRVRKVNTSGIISTIAGNGSGGYGGDGSDATAASLNTPVGVCVDAVGNVYIADANNNRVRKVNTSGIITTIAGNGTAGFSGDGAAATAASLNYPMGVCIDTAGNLYFSDEITNHVRKVNTSGIISTIAGDGTTGFSGDGGAATVAQLWHPMGVHVDIAGNIYIADNANNRIRKISTSGIISTFAGNGTHSYGGDGGPATAAEINSPAGVYVDITGSVYIGDVINNRIRKIAGSSTYTPPVYQEHTINVFPNPAINTLTISSPDDIHSIVLTNMAGKNVCNLEWAVTGKQKQINTSAYPPGTYLVRVNGIDVQKFVKE